MGRLRRHHTNLMPLFFLYLGGCSISKKQTNHRHFALLNVKGWTAKLTLSVTRKTQFETTRKSGCHHSIWWQVGRHVKQKHDEKRRDVISILIVQVIQWKRKGGVSFFCFSLWHIFLFLPPFLFRRRKGVLFSAWHFDAVLNVNILQLIWRGVLCVVRHCVFYSRTNRIYWECFTDVILFNFDCFEFRIGRPASTWLFDQHVIKVMTIFLCGY